MPAQTESLKRRQSTPTKTRDSLDTEPSPKRRKSVVNYDSPVSSPIKGPLQECTEKNSPSFVAKCFYGLKKSCASKENVPSVADKNTSSSDDSSNRSGPAKTFDLGNGKSVYPRSHLDEMMLERVAKSPVKQALLLQTCSMSAFRKMFRDEYKELEQEAAMKNRRMTRGSSRIITQRDEEEEEADEECEDDSSSDDEVILKLPEFSSTAQRKHDEPESSDNDDSSVEQCETNGLTRRSMRKSVSECTPMKTKGSLLKQKEESSTQKKVNGYKEGSTVDMHKLEVTPAKSLHKTANKTDKLDTPQSSGRKFFKTRSPMDNCKKSSVVFGKGFNLKFVPTPGKSPGTKAQRGKQRKQPNSTPPKKTQLPEIKSTNSVEPKSPQSGFTFAPGFLTPEKNPKGQKLSIPENPGNQMDDKDEPLDVNKSNRYTYQTSPKQNSIRNESPGDSACSSGSDIVDLPNNSHSSSTHGQYGTDDLYSSQNDSALGKDSGNVEDQTPSPSQKLFPIFSRRNTRTATSASKMSSASKPSDSSPLTKALKLPRDIGNSQMIIDAGQKKFGVTQCSVCGMVYCQADPTDEAAHGKFHKKLVEVLKFPGWKDERIIQHYPMDDGRVILVLADDRKYAKKKVQEVNQVMGRELGFPDATPSLNNPYHKVFFYILEKQIAGCCVAEPIAEGYRIMPDDLDNKEESGQRPWCCAKVPERACVGICRLWVPAQFRKQGIATKLVDCVSQWFNYGSLIPKHMIAFSDPTPDGRRFAQKYIGAPTFLVYKYRQ